MYSDNGFTANGKIRKEEITVRSYLKYKLAQKKIERVEVQKLLNVSEATLNNKLAGRTDFTWGEARTLRNKYFPKEDFEKLFAQDDE